MSAGLAIYYGVLIYTEIDDKDEHKILRTEKILLPENCIRDSRINLDMLESAFKELKAKKPKPFVLGVPDAFITPVQFPDDMDAQDVRGALEFDFEKYFHDLKIEDVVFDAVKMVLPNKTIFFAAAVNLNAITNVLDIAKKTGLEVLAVEPENFSLYRILPKTDDELFMAITKNAAIATSNGKMIFIRDITRELTKPEIQLVVKIVETKQPSAKVKGVIKITDDNNALLAQSLAMREFSDTKMDLRPREKFDENLGEAQKFEKVELIKKAPENPAPSKSTLLALKILMASCFLIALLTGGMAFFNYSRANTQIDFLRQMLNTSEARLEKLKTRNAELQAESQKIDEAVNFMAGEIPVHEVLEVLEANAGAGINFLKITFYRDNNENFAQVNAETSDEKNLVAMTSGIDESDLISNLVILHSEKNSKGVIKFNMILKIKDVYANSNV